MICAARKRLRIRLPKKSILIVVENLPVPLDRRVWQEATALRDAGYEVVVICPQMHGQTLAERHRWHSDLPAPLSTEAKGFWGFFLEYTSAFGERRGWLEGLASASV